METLKDGRVAYLHINEFGAGFSTNKNREYVLSNNSSTGNAQLHEITDGQLILRDPHVQINSKYTPDGSIEIGGLVQAGSRVYIMRSGEDIVAFGSEDGWTVNKNMDNPVVLYSGKKPAETAPDNAQTLPTNVVNSEIPAEESSATMPDNNITNPSPISTINDQTIYNETSYINIAKLNNGEYTSKDGILYDFSGQVLGKSWYDNGIYKVQKNQVYKMETLKDGRVAYLHINEFGAGFSTNKNFIDENGKTSEVASYEFLREHGISTEKINLSYIFLLIS